MHTAVDGKEIHQACPKVPAFQWCKMHAVSCRVGQSKARAGAFGAAGTEGRAVWLTRENSPAWFCIFSVPSSAFSLQKRIAECQYWPVEVCRMPVVSSSKGKTSKADKVKMEGLCCSSLWGSTVLLGVFCQCLCYTKTSLEPAKASQRARGFVKGLISLIELLNKQRIRFLPYSLQISHLWSVLAWWRGVGGRLLFEK